MIKEVAQIYLGLISIWNNVELSEVSKVPRLQIYNLGTLEVSYSKNKKPGKNARNSGLD